MDLRSLGSPLKADALKADAGEGNFDVPQADWNAVAVGKELLGEVEAVVEPDSSRDSSPILQLLKCTDGIAPLPPAQSRDHQLATSATVVGFRTGGASSGRAAVIQRAVDQVCRGSSVLVLFVLGFSVGEWGVRL